MPTEHHKRKIDSFITEGEAIIYYLCLIMDFFYYYERAEGTSMIITINRLKVMQSIEKDLVAVWLSNNANRHRLTATPSTFSLDIQDRLKQPKQVFVVISFEYFMEPTIVVDVVAPWYKGGASAASANRTTYRRSYNMSSEYNSSGNNGTFGMMYRLFKSLQINDLFTKEIKSKIDFFKKASSQ